MSGLDESTSCQDILRSLAASNVASWLKSEDVEQKKLLLVEKWRDVEQPLASEAKILPIWRSWGEEQKYVKFVVKRVSLRSHLRKKRKSMMTMSRRSSISSIDEVHPNVVKLHQQQPDQEVVIEEMMKIIELQRKVITEELNKSKKKAKIKDLKVILDELHKLASLNDKLQFAEESVDRLEIALKLSSNNSEEDRLIQDHLECAKTEVSKLKEANNEANEEVKDNQKSLEKMEEIKAERKLALKRLEYDVNVIEKEGRKLAKEYEKVMSIKIDILEEETNLEEETILEEEIYYKDNGSTASSSGNSSDKDFISTVDLAKESPIDHGDKNVNTILDENNSDTGLSSLHTSSDEGVGYEVGTLV